MPINSDIAKLLGIDPHDPLTCHAHALVHADSELMCSLIRARYDSGLTAEVVAKRMGTTPGAVRKLERADADPKLSTIRRYALAIGVVVSHEVTPFKPEVSDA